MRSILILNASKYPGEFDEVLVTPPRGFTKLQYVETQILNAINTYNSKLNVVGIEYSHIEALFPNYETGSRNAVLVEEFSINPELENRYKSHECYVKNTVTDCICRRIIMYLFISPVDEGTRTALVSQTVFPALLDYAKRYIDSPSYTIANHKFCYIDILNKSVTATMILRHLAGLCAAGMDYVDVFGLSSIVPNRIPKDVKIFLQKYSSDFGSNYSEEKDIYEDDNYRVEFGNKNIVLKTESMISKLIGRTPGTVDFKGSAEKFYWIETIPMALLAYNSGYKVDYSSVSDFVITYKTRFSASSEKFGRFEIMVEYFNKYFV